MTPSAATIEQLSAVLAASPFMNQYPLSVTSCAPGECTVRMAYSPSFERSDGIISGPTLVAAADVAMWLAIMTLRGTGEQWVTTDLKTAFLRSARAEDVICIGRVLKAGRRAMYGTAECHGATNGLVAHHVLTYARVDRPESEP